MEGRPVAWRDRLGTEGSAGHWRGRKGSQAGGRAYAKAVRQDAEPAFRAEGDMQPVGKGFSMPD